MSVPVPVLAVPVTLMIVTICTAFGRRMTKLLGLKSDSEVEISVLGAAFGLGVLAYLVLALGLIGYLYAWSVILLIAGLAFTAGEELRVLICGTLTGLTTGAREKSGVLGTVTLLAVVVLGAMVLIASLAPPSALDWDGLAYHLAVAKMYIAQHRIHYVPFISHSNFAFLTEMLYTVGLLFGSTAIAKLFHYTMYLLTAAGIAVLCRRHLPQSGASVGALLFMSVPLAVWEGGSAYADLTTALYVLLMVYAVLNWEETSEAKWLAAAGVMGGFAFGTKFLGSVPVLAVCAWVVVCGWRSGGLGRGVRYALMVAMIAVLIGSPWYVKSWVYTGNPVYPFLYNVFGGRNWSHEAAESYRAAQLAMGMGRNAADFILLPWNIVMYGTRFFDSPIIYGLLGPAFLGLLGIQVCLSKAHRNILKLLWVSGVFIAAWFFLMQNSRYLITVLPLLAATAGAIVTEANREWKASKYVVNAFVVLCVALGVLVALGPAHTAGRVVVGLETQDAFLARTLDGPNSDGLYEAERFINRKTPYDAKVALYDEPRGFYLDRDYIWANPGHHELIPYRSFETGGDLADWLMDHGYTHVLINHAFAPRKWAERYQQLLMQAIGYGRMVEVFDCRGVNVYELRR